MGRSLIGADKGPRNWGGGNLQLCKGCGETPSSQEEQCVCFFKERHRGEKPGVGGCPGAWGRGWGWEMGPVWLMGPRSKDLVCHLWGVLERRVHLGNVSQELCLAKEKINQAKHQVSVWICSGCHNQKHRLGGLTKRSWFSHNSGG